MNSTPVSYRTRLKKISMKHPWITQHHVKPMPGHIDLIVRLLDLCEMAMGTPSPSFSVFQVRYLLNNMRITAIPTQGAECDLIALRKAIDLTLGEAKFVCLYCGDYQTIGQSFQEAYVCCPSSGNLVLREKIPDIISMVSAAFR